MKHAPDAARKNELLNRTEKENAHQFFFTTGWIERFAQKNQLVFEQIQRVGRRKGSTECALRFHQHTGKFIGGFASLTPLDATHICEFAQMIQMIQMISR